MIINISNEPPLILSIFSNWDKCSGGWLAATSFMKDTWSALCTKLQFKKIKEKKERQPMLIPNHPFFPFCIYTKEEEEEES